MAFTEHDPQQLQPLFAAPFLYAEQLMRASSVLTVPIECLAETGLAEAGQRPIFVFSPGRTGSTLLMQVMTEAGLQCASEPDMLTQIGRMGRADRHKLPPGAETLLAGACIGALGRALGEHVVIKLRSQCNTRPLAFLDASPGCRVVFMLRRMMPWALSRHRVFQEPADSVAAVLRHGVDALDKLLGAGVPMSVLWFERLVADPVGALAACAADLGLPELEVDAARLSGIMSADSQEGTGIARDLVRGLPVQDGFIEQFRIEWEQARNGAEWSAPTEALLSEMWVR